MSFIRKIWADFVTGNTPITAAELNRIEQGVADDDVTNPASAASAALLTNDATAASPLRVQQDARQSATFAPRIRLTTTSPRPQLTQLAGGGVYINVESTKFHSYDIFGIYQIESLTDTQQGSAWTPKGIPAGTVTNSGFPKLVLFKGNYYGQFKASGVSGIYRAAPVANPTAFSWSAALATQVSGADTIMTGLATDGVALLWAEYGDPVGGPSLRRSTDGTTWTTVVGPLSTSRHMHGVYPDPYIAGHWVLTVGDAGCPGYTYESFDSGATWALMAGPVGATQAWQTVQVSFSATAIYFASDASSLVAFKVPRSTGVPEWISTTFAGNTPVPGGLPARRITDLATTSGSNTATSATAAFTANDVGALVRTIGQNFVQIGTYIQAVTNGTTVVLSKPATTSRSGAEAVISGEIFGAAAYYGAVDPATGIFYFGAVNGAIGGNTGGLFALYPGGRVELLDVLPTQPLGQVFIANGSVYVQGFSRPLLAIA
jgi:hypothetical protein